MSTRRNKSSKSRKTSSKSAKELSPAIEDQHMRHSADPSMAVTSSLDGTYVGPRTPITARPHSNRLGLQEENDVELHLLDEDERRRAREGLESRSEEDLSKRPLSAKDTRAMALLCVLFRTGF
ncbi:hypothetical protein MPER_10656, partial [Moniliophthora perniciosa FA553]